MCHHAKIASDGDTHEENENCCNFDKYGPIKLILYSQGKQTNDRKTSENQSGRNIGSQWSQISQRARIILFEERILMKRHNEDTHNIESIVGNSQFIYRTYHYTLCAHIRRRRLLSHKNKAQHRLRPNYNNSTKTKNHLNHISIGCLKYM